MYMLLNMTYLAKDTVHKFATPELAQSNYKPLIKLRNRTWPASEVPLLPSSLICPRITTIMILHQRLFFCICETLYDM